MGTTPSVKDIYAHVEKDVLIRKLEDLARIVRIASEAGRRVVSLGD